jgi:hypothetical protein
VLHMTYLNGARLAPTVRLSVFEAPLESGDELALDYPNGDSATATVVSCSANTLVIVVNDTKWRLMRIKVPIGPSKTDTTTPTIWEFLAS